ncbi:MAG: hypothetical protein IPP12_22395 [Nitrospira sp.]|nr:hypothetical protein [Nitrospira sp.]
MNYRDYDREVHGDEAATEVAKLEAKNEALQKRVAELERCMKEVGLLAFMRDAAPGDITEHMNRVMGSYTQRLAAYQTRVAELESKFRDSVNTSAKHRQVHLDMIKAYRDQIASLQSQIAWTPVSKGLPTKPGVYEFLRSTAATVETEEFDGATWQNPLHAWSRDPRTSEPRRLWDYTHYRKVELP